MRREVLESIIRQVSEDLYKIEGVRGVEVFGSVLKDLEKANDIDILVRCKKNYQQKIVKEIGNYFSQKIREDLFETFKIDVFLYKSFNEIISNKSKPFHILLV